MPKLHFSSPNVRGTKRTPINIIQALPLSWYEIRAKASANLTPSARRLEAFFDRVETLYKVTNPLTICTKDLPIKKDYLRQLCKKITGQTPTQCIAARQVIEATRLLSEGKLSIKEIAWELGLSTHSHLVHIFKKQTGMTPSEYRKLVSR